MPGEDSPKFRGIIWIRRGLEGGGERSCSGSEVARQLPGRVGASELRRFLVPPGAGNSEAPGGESRSPALWGVRPFRPRPENHQMPVPETLPFCSAGRRGGPACGVPGRMWGHLAEKESLFITTCGSALGSWRA